MKRSIIFYFILSLIILLFISCKGKPDVGNFEDVMVLTVHERSIDGNVDLTEIVDAVTYIPLETTRESLVARIEKAFFVDDKVIVISGQQALFFDRSGKFIRKISRRGRGPGEYINLDKAMLDEGNKRIIIYDASSRKLLFYDFEGQFIKDVPNFAVNYFPRDIIDLPNGNFLCYRPDHEKKIQSNPSGLWEVDSTGVFKRWIIRDDFIHPVITTQTGHTYFYPLQEGRIGFIGAETNNCYCYDGKKMIEYCKYVFDGKTGKDYEGMDDNEFTGPFSKGERFLTKDYIFDNGRYIFSGWNDDVGKIFYTLYDRSDGSSKTTRTPADSDSPRIITYNNDVWKGWEVVFSNDPNVIVILARHDLFYNPETWTDNPVLQILHVKK